MKHGDRIRINKSDPDQDQLIAVGERGTIESCYVDEEYHVIMDIVLDTGEALRMDSTTFRFDVYKK